MKSELILIAHGDKDVYLLDKPNIEGYKKKYRKYTDFAEEPVEVSIHVAPSSEEQVEVKRPSQKSIWSFRPPPLIPTTERFDWGEISEWIRLGHAITNQKPEANLKDDPPV